MRIQGRQQQQKGRRVAGVRLLLLLLLLPGVNSNQQRAGATEGRTVALEWAGERCMLQ